MTVPVQNQGHHAGLRRRLFAWLTNATEKGTNRMLDAHKRDLFQNIEGRVLEIGPGSGANLPYLPAGIEWIGVEPNPAMHDYLREKAANYNITPDFRIGSAEKLDVPDSSVDVVICTLVLCSVANPEEVLREIHRVLKPGGRFIFLEHVAAPEGTGLRRVQNWIQPIWSFVVDGCHPNRETWAALESASFAWLEYDHFRNAGPGITSPTIAGVATKS